MCLVVDSGSLTLFQSRQGTTLLTPEDIWFKCDLYLRFIPPINLWKICIDMRPFHTAPEMSVSGIEPH